MSAIPPSLRRKIDDYVLYGTEPGGHFMNALLMGDLYAAVGYADSESLTALPHLVDYVRCHVPHGAFGTPERVAEWQRRGGLAK